MDIDKPTQTHNQPIYENMITNPLVPMTLRIGVVGHRELPATELQRLQSEIEATYTNIGHAIQQLATDETASALYAKDTQPVIRIISSLAEGADRLCIQPELIPFSHELACILPFSKKDFEQDFLPENSVIDQQLGTVAEFNAILARMNHGQPSVQVIEMDGNLNNRDQAYKDCSRLLVAHSDILIAVYNGDDSEDKGTATAVNAARQNGVPVIHISTLPNTPTQCYCSCRFGCEQDSSKLLTLDLLLEELRRVLLFSDILEVADDVSQSRRQEIFDRFKQYQADQNLLSPADNKADFDFTGPIKLKQEYKNPIARTFDFLKNIIATPVKIEKELETLKEKNTHPITAQEPSNVEDHLAKTSLNKYFAAYLRADRLANYYSRIHRSIFVWIYLLGAAALITAACALAFKAYPCVVLICVLVELTLLVAIHALYQKDHQQKYHDHWLEYRCLAEFLRPMLYLSALGRPYVMHDFRDTVEYLDREVIGHSAVGRSWLYIYTEMINRWAGFNSCHLDAQYKQDTNNFIITNWINKQINYHTQNAATMRVLGNQLREWSFRLFFATVVVVALKLITISINLALDTKTISDVISYTLALGAAILPICATTAYAIRNHAEFDISSQRSLSMRTALISRRNKLTNRATLTTSQMTSILNEISTITIKETADWLEIYEVKDNEL